MCFKDSTKQRFKQILNNKIDIWSSDFVCEVRQCQRSNGAASLTWGSRLLKIKSGSRLQRNVTVKSRRQPQRALSSRFVRDAQKLLQKKRAWDTYSSASVLMTETRRQSFWRREECDIQCSSLGHAAEGDKSSRARLTPCDQVHQCWVHGREREAEQTHRQACQSPGEEMGRGGKW